MTDDYLRAVIAANREADHAYAARPRHEWTEQDIHAVMNGNAEIDRLSAMGRIATGLSTQPTEESEIDRISRL